MCFIIVCEYDSLEYWFCSNKLLMIEFVYFYYINYWWIEMVREFMIDIKCVYFDLNNINSLVNIIRVVFLYFNFFNVLYFNGFYFIFLLFKII